MTTGQVKLHLPCLYLLWLDLLGLIDYGQVKRLTELERLNCAKAVLLVAASFEHDPRSNPEADLQAHERAKAAVAAHMHYQACTQHAHAHEHAHAIHRPCTQHAMHMHMHMNMPGKGMETEKHIYIYIYIRG